MRGLSTSRVDLECPLPHGESAHGPTCLLETRDLTIRFGGHVAVDAVSCAFRPAS